MFLQLFQANYSGKYMVTEIAVRNFTDTYRYNLLEKVAETFEFGTLKTNVRSLLNELFLSVPNSNVSATFSSKL
jgi:nitric oxide synthase oxygenase domain/subunit